jgi:hypothetical protein
VSKEIPQKIEFENLFAEINTIFKRYGVDKGIGFVPDRLKIDIIRGKQGVFEINYQEYFNYLPPEVMEIAVGNAIELLTRLGIADDKIIRLEGGVQVTLKGDSSVINFPVLEIIIQNQDLSKSLDSTCDNLKESIRNLLNLFEFNYEWTAEAEMFWRNNISRLNEIISSNPDLAKDIENLVKKYSLNKKL